MISSSSVRYGLSSAAGWLDAARRRCPNCGSSVSRLVERKWLVTQLVRCGACRLMFRLPADAPGAAEDFYQEKYRAGFTSTCPSPAELAALLDCGFAGTTRDYTRRIAVLRALGVGAGARVLDYGASWGYGVWQLRASGYDACGFEIGRPRAAYAREQVSVPVFGRIDDLPVGLDVFFSSHVLEHVPAPGEIIALAKRLLRRGGLFVAFTPNGSAARRARPDEAENVTRMWGQAHPLVLDDEFYRHALDGTPKLIASNPFALDRIQSWDQRTDRVEDLSGGELLVAAVV